MSLLEALGGEWAAPVSLPVLTVPSTARPVWVRHVEKFGATHGCAECGLPPAEWSDALGGYVDGMGRLTRCGYCPSCAGTGWTLLRDPWTGAPVSSWHEVPCGYCYGGWHSHRWDCTGHDDADRREPHTVTVYGTDSRGRVYFPGDVVAPDPRLCINAPKEVAA